MFPLSYSGEKCCDGPNAFIFDRIVFKLVGNEDRQKSRTSLILGQIGLFALELLALERRIFSP